MTEETITRYVAKDGAIFEDERDCLIYEGTLYAGKVSFFVYSDDGGIKKMLPTISDNVANADIIVIKTMDGACWVDEACEENGIKSPFDKTDEFKTGIFVYNEYEDEWDDWEEYFKRMTDKNEQMIKLLNW